MGNMPLPPRRNRESCIIKREYSYSELIQNNIPLDHIEYITISQKDLDNKHDLLRKIMDENKIMPENKKMKIKFCDWSSALFVDDMLESPTDIDCFLIDDGLVMHRDYIDLSILKNINISIPLTYLMWGVHFCESVKTYCLKLYNQSGNYIVLSSQNGNEKISKEDLLKIKEEIIRLKSLGVTETIDKINLISDYIQSRTQFIEDYESNSIRGVFVTPDFPIGYRQAAYIESVLNHNNGKCVAISNFSTLLLNNPEFNIEVETVFNSDHAWNRVLIDGTYYYFDNTWDITRTDNPSDEGLITLSFSRKYNMFGQKMADNIGHHVPYPNLITFYDHGLLSMDNISEVPYSSKFEYPTKPFYKSYKK